MKKIVLGLSAIALLSLASCKKDRNCECTYQNTGNTTITENNTIKNATLKDAKETCDDYETGGMFPKTCTLL